MAATSGAEKITHASKPVSQTNVTRTGPASAPAQQAPVGDAGRSDRSGGGRPRLTAATPDDGLAVKQLRNNEANVPMRANINAPPKEVGR